MKLARFKKTSSTTIIALLALFGYIHAEMMPDPMTAEAAATEVPAEEVPAAEGTAKAPAAGPDTSENLEKIGLQGNWVKKREWLLKAHEIFADIQGLSAEIEVLRKTFLSKLNDTDALLDSFYGSIGVDQGKIQELFEDVSRYLDKKRKKDMSNAGAATSDMKQDPEMSAKIDVIESHIKKSRDSLEQLRLDTESIADLGKSVIDRIKRVDERIVVVQELLRQAQDTINDMWEIVDHNLARNKYYELSTTIHEKIKSEKAYLEEDLMQDLDSVIATIQSQIDKTKENIKKLEGDGVFIQDRSSKIRELKLKDIEKKDDNIQVSTKENAAAAQEAGSKKNKPAAVKPRSFTEKVYDWGVAGVAYVIEKAVGMYDQIMHLAFAKTDKTAPTKKVQDKPKEIPQMPT